MISLGNDIIEIERVANLIEKHGTRFLDKTFTKKEQEYCLSYAESARHFAGRFAAKEAVAKALGTGFRDEITWTGIEILPDANGKPQVILSKEIRARFGDLKMALSISHCKTYATAVAIAGL